jgi:ribosomal protein L18
LAVVEVRRRWRYLRVANACEWWNPDMRLGQAAWLFRLLGMMLQLRPAYALQFELVPAGQAPAAATGQLIGGRGPIIDGDAARLEHALAAVPQGSGVLALELDSPGGSIREGMKLAELIGKHRLTVFIPPNSTCASACFLLLAASPHRLAASDALVGVHNASEGGQDTGASLAVTTLMARYAGEQGIPPAIIGKMVQTKPGRVAWLTPDDLVSMDVTIVDNNGPVATPPPQPATLPALAPAPAPSPPPTAAPAPALSAPGFADGRIDRRAWEAWLAGQFGAAHDGAMFALGQLGRPHPVSCYGPNRASLGDFTLGCRAARRRLAQVGSLMGGNPDYADGWNNAGTPLGAIAPVEAEYHGVFFCVGQRASLTLKLFRPLGEARRRASFSFGPQPTSPDVPAGEFIMEGTIDLHGGAIILRPVRWVHQPAGYPWLGLSGRSDDGGKTYSGSVIDSSVCSSFTLQRIGNATASK